MKHIPALSAVAALAFTGCETMNAPVSSTSFDPLAAPGGGSRVTTVEAGPEFRAGQFVRATMDNTGFFRVRPRGDADADRLLDRGTQMRVISTDASYVQVELDSGETGYVPAIMVEEPSAASAEDALPPSGDEFQVYPPVEPVDPSDPLPFIDPTAAAPDEAMEDTPVPPVDPDLDPAKPAAEEEGDDELPPSSPSPFGDDELPPSSE